MSKTKINDDLLNDVTGGAALYASEDKIQMLEKNDVERSNTAENSDANGAVASAVKLGVRANGILTDNKAALEKTEAVLNNKILKKNNLNNINR